MHAELREAARAIPLEKLDQDAVRIIRRLTENGFPAYLVGGCVRDLLFGLKPKDFDVATSATPRDVRRLFRNCRIIGRRFRLAHVFFRDKIIEVATFRAAGPGPDSADGFAGDAEAAAGTEADIQPGTDLLAGGTVETPLDLAPSLPFEMAPEAGAAAEPDPAAQAGASVRGTRAARGGHGGHGRAESGLIIRDDNVFGTAEQDALRRDFTVNALFYDIERQVILDYVGGVEDTLRKQIRTIGDARIRLREDPIRMLRAIRLAARMGCTIHEETWEAIREFRFEIPHAAAPRIGEDVLRMFRGGAILPALDMMRESGVLSVILPELAAQIERSPNELEALRTALRVTDARTQAGTPLTGPAQMSLLLAPTLLAPEAANGAPGRSARMDDVAERLRPIAARLAISRKDAERIRQVLTTLPKLLPPAGPARKRRAPGPLLRRAFFPETLDVFEVMALATGDCRDEAARWRRKLAEAGPPAPEEPRSRPGLPPRPQQRRRPRRQ